MAGGAGLLAAAAVTAPGNVRECAGSGGTDEMSRSLDKEGVAGSNGAIGRGLVQNTYLIYRGGAIAGTVIDDGEGGVTVRSAHPDLEPIVRRLLTEPAVERIGGVIDRGDGDLLCWDGIRYHNPGDPGHVAAAIGFGLPRYGYKAAKVA